jgi:hypothetical protein
MIAFKRRDVSRHNPVAFHRASPSAEAGGRLWEGDRLKPDIWPYGHVVSVERVNVWRNADGDPNNCTPNSDLVKQIVPGIREMDAAGT